MSQDFYMWFFWMRTPLERRARLIVQPGGIGHRSSRCMLGLFVQHAYLEIYETHNKNIIADLIR